MNTVQVDITRDQTHEYLKEDDLFLQFCSDCFCHAQLNPALIQFYSTGIFQPMNSVRI